MVEGTSRPTFASWPTKIRTRSQYTFNVDNHVLKVFEDSPIENLEEFRFYFTTEDQIDQFVAQAADLRKEDLRIQIARVRRAWAAVRQGAKKREEGRSVTHSVDLDDLLEETTLHEVRYMHIKTSI